MTADEFHRIVAEDREIRRVAKERAEVDRARERYLERQREAEARHRAAVAAWTREHDAAVLRGEDPPPEPEPEAVYRGGNPERTFMEERRRLDAKERDVLARRADEFRSAIRGRADEVTAEARELVDRLDALAAEARTLAQTDVQVRRAAGERPAAAPSHDAPTLAAVVQAGADVLAAAPDDGKVTVTRFGRS